MGYKKLCQTCNLLICSWLVFLRPLGLFVTVHLLNVSVQVVRAL